MTFDDFLGNENCLTAFRTESGTFNFARTFAFVPLTLLKTEINGKT